MGNFFSLGFNLASPESVSLKELSVNNRLFQLQEELDSWINISSWWQPIERTIISLKVEVDQEKIYKDCLLLRGDQVYLTMHSYCPGTRLQHKSDPKKISEPEIVLQLDIPRSHWCDFSVLKVTVSASIGSDLLRVVGSPHVSHSKLLEKSVELQLSGQQTQGNVISTDFSNDRKISKALWKIVIDPSVDTQDWETVEHSRMLRVEINSKEESNFQDVGLQVLLLTDIIMASLDAVMQDEEKLQLVKTESVIGGSWLRFLRNAYGNLFSLGEPGVKEKWNQNQDSIRSRVQHLMMENIGGLR